MLGRFREDLVLPYLDVLRRFSPLGSCPRWQRERGGTREPAARVAEGATAGD